MPTPLGKETAIIKMARCAASMLPKGHSTLLNAAAKLSGSGRNFCARINAHGFSMIVELDEVVSRTVYVRGCFEPAVTRVFSKLVRPNDVVLDIGANLGFFTLLAAQQTQKGGKVFAFEPDPLNSERLRQNLKLNDFPHAEMIAAAVFNQIGTATLRLGRGGNLGVSSLMGDQSQASHELVTVPTVTIDSFCEEKQITKVALAKIDIEGAEVGALEGATISLKNHVIKHFIIELHERVIGIDGLRKIFSLFNEAGYQLSYVLKDMTSGPLRRMLTPAKLDESAGVGHVRSSDFKELHLLASSPEGAAELALL